MSGKKVIITGATSFIGKALIRRIIATSDYEIIAVVRPSSKRKDNITKDGRVHVMEVELSELDNVEDEMIMNSEILFHLGWNSDFENPRYNLTGQLQNVNLTEKAIKMAKRSGCKKIVCVGSQAECGRVVEPISELTPSNPQTAYAIAKCRAYECAVNMCDECGLQLYWPRLLSAYGPYDKMHTFIMTCLRAAIYKQDIALTKCEQIWDYIFVDDVADALLAIVKRGTSGVKYSIASGRGRALYEYVEEISEVIGNDKILEYVGGIPYVTNQVMYLVGDITRLKKDTGFCPKISFGQGINEIINTNFKS